MTETRLSIRRIAAAGLAAVALGGCALTDPPPPPAAPQFAFETGDILALAVREIRVEERFTPALRAPNIEHQFPVAPADIVRRWARDKLRATGGSGDLVLAITEAGVTERDVETPARFAPFRRGVDRRMEGVIRVEGTYMDQDQTLLIEVNVAGTIDIDRQATLNRREAQYNALLEELAERFDEALARRLREGMGALVVN